MKAGGPICIDERRPMAPSPACNASVTEPERPRDISDSASCSRSSDASARKSSPAWLTAGLGSPAARAASMAWDLRRLYFVTARRYLSRTYRRSLTAVRASSTCNITPQRRAHVKGWVGWDTPHTTSHPTTHTHKLRTALQFVRGCADGRNDVLAQMFRKDAVLSRTNKVSVSHKRTKVRVLSDQQACISCQQAPPVLLCWRRRLARTRTQQLECRTRSRRPLHAAHTAVSAPLCFPTHSCSTYTL